MEGLILKERTCLCLPQIYVEETVLSESRWTFRPLSTLVELTLQLAKVGNVIDKRQDTIV